MDEMAGVRSRMAELQQEVDALHDRIQLLDEQKARIEERLAPLEEKLRGFALVLQDHEEREQLHRNTPTRLRSATVPPEFDDAPTVLPELRDLPSHAERLKALARMHGRHLYTRYAARVWQDTLGSKATNLSGHLYGILNAPPWHQVAGEEGHYVLVEDTGAADDANGSPLLTDQALGRSFKRTS